MNENAFEFLHHMTHYICSSFPKMSNPHPLRDKNGNVVTIKLSDTPGFFQINLWSGYIEYKLVNVKQQMSPDKNVAECWRAFIPYLEQHA